MHVIKVRAADPLRCSEVLTGNVHRFVHRGGGYHRARRARSQPWNGGCACIRPLDPWLDDPFPDTLDPWRDDLFPD
jgi:hypothetical protein